MGKQFSAILFLLVFLLEVAHDAIPHHHPEQNKIEITTHHNYDRSGCLINTEEHQHSFPPHQHYYCAEDLTPTRVSNPFHTAFKKVLCESVLMSPYKRQELHKPPGIKFPPNFSVSLQNYPFIISPDATRGSPSLS